MSQDIKALLESVLLVSNKPLSFKELASILGSEENLVKDSIAILQSKFNQEDSGIHLALNNNKVQLISNPKFGKWLQNYLKDELTGELTNASLETLSIIAYRQPISKEELEQIRGVNCSLIIRNLLIRGLIEAQEEKGDLAPKYCVTMDFIKHLGISAITDLPNYDKLNSDASLEKLLAEQEPENSQVTV